MESACRKAEKRNVKSPFITLLLGTNSARVQWRSGRAMQLVVFKRGSGQRTLLTAREETNK